MENRKEENVMKISIPPGIRYISDWEEFYYKFPRFPHIMDKQIPGCGFTEWCLTNRDNVILCSPRNMLILNKWEQHIDDVYRVYNDSFDIDPGVDKDLEEEPKPGSVNIVENLRKQSEEEKRTFQEKLQIELEAYFSKMDALGKPYKILVTYDSFRQLKDKLEFFKKFNSFQIIVDEFQSIFTDSRFKSNTEMEFVNTLQGIQKVCYLSATPMMNEYLKMIPEFADLPYYELDWESLDPLRVMKPLLKVRIIRSVYEPIKKIIDEYKSGNFEIRHVDDGSGKIKIVESKEAMIFVNSVKNIITIIKKCELSPDEVNILCSNTPENLKKIQKTLGKEYSIGKVPLRGEERKMFTLCTRTVYLGADFYSDNARSFILSDANINTLAVDISLDLPQIMGRQRLPENPWKNEAEFYYKPLVNENKEKLERKDYEAEVEWKLQVTQNLLNAWKDTRPEAKHSLADTYQRMARLENYKENYVSVNTHTGNDLVPVINNLVMVAERRAYDIQQRDYKDRFTVFNAMAETFNSILGEDNRKEIKQVIGLYELAKSDAERLKLICDPNLSELARKYLIDQAESRIKGYLTLGYDRIRALGYHTTKIKKELGIVTFSKNDLKTLVQEEFKEGDRIAKSDIKERLAEIYNKIKYKKTPKANDLEEWFDLKPVLITVEGKRVHGFELVEKK